MEKKKEKFILINKDIRQASPLNFLPAFFLLLALLLVALGCCSRRLADEEVELADVEVDSAGEASAPGVGTS